MSAAAGSCRGCGAPLPPPPRPGRPRQWCKESCRKRTLYAGRCVECGAATSGSEGRGPRAPKRCQACAGRQAGARSRERAAPRRALIERLWAEGQTVRQIGELMGWAPHARKSKISRLRQLGYHLPHRPRDRRVRALGDHQMVAGETSARLSQHSRTTPWRDGMWLGERFYTSKGNTGRRSVRYELPLLDLKAKRRALSDKQLRALRSRWIATSVVLCDFTGRERCSRAIAVNRLVDLHELVTILCASVGFEDDEHLYHLEIGSGFYSAQQYVWVERAEPAHQTTLADLKLSRGDSWHLHYDMGDSWHFFGRVQTLPAAIAPALRAFERDHPDTPAVRYRTGGRAPKQYPHADEDW